MMSGTTRLRTTLATGLVVMLLCAVSCGDPPGDKPECTTNADCTTDQTCAEGSCKAILCSTTADCRGGWECDTATKRCAKADPCPERKQGGCCENDHCMPGQKCANHICRQATCSSDRDCTEAPNTKCFDSDCVHKDHCEKNDDCTVKERPLCKDKRCVATGAGLGDPCTDDKACRKGLLCTAHGAGKQCRESCDPFNPVCVAGTVCKYLTEQKGVCVPRPSSGAHHGEQCESVPYQPDTVCVKWTSELYVCASPCRLGKADCSSGESCIDFGGYRGCVKETHACGAGSPCSSGWTCDTTLSRCRPDRCPHKPCPGTEKCHMGACVGLNCCQGDTCPAGRVCNRGNGSCVELEVTVPYCTACTKSGGCSMPTDRCAQLGKEPDDRLCTSECAGTKKCSDPLFSCQPWKGTFLCLPRVGTCKDRCSGVSCPKGEFCFPADGKCGKIGLAPCAACDTDLQCGGPTDACIKPAGGGKGYCGLDCSVSCTPCPDGYVCKTLGSLKQCVPTSGKCSG